MHGGAIRLRNRMAQQKRNHWSDSFKTGTAGKIIDKIYYSGPNGPQDGSANRPLNLRMAMLFAAILAAIAISVIVLTLPNPGVSQCSHKVIMQSKYQCYTYYAIKEDNVSVCNGVQGLYRDECINAFAYNRSAIGACGMINYTPYKVYCFTGISAIRKNASGCSALTEPNRSMCLFGVAASLNFSTFQECTAITNTSYKSRCNSMYYFNRATRSMNASYCGYLPGYNNTDVLADVMGVSTNLTGAVNFALYSNYNLTPFEYCYSRLAFLKHNISECYFLSGAPASICESQFANPSYSAVNISNMTASCGSLPADEQQLCLSGVSIYNALITKNMSICNKLNSSDSQYTCAVDIASKYGNATYCSYLTNSTLANNCYIYMRYNSSIK